MNDKEHSIRHQIDERCDSFERALQAGRNPPVEQFLNEFPLEHVDQLRAELVAVGEDYKEAYKSDPDATVASSTYDPEATEATGDPDATIDSQMASTAVSLPAGEKLKYFGNYEIINEIARGGMGVVYRARQTTLGRTVALKMILSGQLAGEHEVARFRSEAEAAANLDHPAIVAIYEVGQHDDHHYFSMALVDGPSLSQRLREGPMENLAAAGLMVKIADAVGYANDRGVIHRDLKPGNILLDAAGDPHVTDFGLAKRLEANTELTHSGEVLGTPAYMPPEQARGDLTAIGPHSDVYALGAILYAMLSGRPPHSAPSMVETLRQVIEVDAISVRTLSPTVPKDLETICAKCLAKEPSKRYATAADLRDELQRFIAGEPILARPVSRLERGWRWTKRRPAAAGLAAALILLALTFAIGGPAVAIGQNRLRSVAEKNERRATRLASSERQAKEMAEQSQRELATAKDRSDHSLYARTISLAHQEWQSGNLIGAEDLLASLPVESRGFEWDYVDSLCHQQLDTFLDMNGIPTLVDMTSDGTHVVASGIDPRSDSNKIFVWQMGQSQPVAVREGEAIAAAAAGDWIAVVPDGEREKFQVVDPITGEVKQTFAGHVGGTSKAAFGGPDESMIATVGRDKTCRVWNIETGKEIAKIVNPFRQRLHPVALSPDGLKVAWRRVDDGGIDIRHVPKGHLIYEGPPQKSFAGHEVPVQFSPDSKILAVGGMGEVILLASDTGDSMGTLQGIRAHALAMDFSPDGKRLVVSSQDGTIRIYDVAGRKLLTTMTGHRAGQAYGIASVSFDNSGDRIVSGGNDAVVKVWDSWNGDQHSVADSVRPDAVLPSPSQSADFVTDMTNMVEQMIFSADGKFLLATGRDHAIAVFDVDSGETVRRWDDLSDNQGAVAFDQESGLIVVGGGSVTDRHSGVVTAYPLEGKEPAWEFAGARGPVASIQFFDTGGKIAVGVGSQRATIGEIMVLDSGTGSVLWRNEQPILPVRELDISPDGKSIASVGVDAGVRIWDATTGKLVRGFGNRSLFCVDYSKDGTQIAAGGVDWSVRIFDAATGGLRWSQTRHGGAVTGIEFTGDGTRLVSTSVDGHTHIWDTKYGSSLLRLRDSDQPNLTLAVSPTSSLIAVSGVNPTIVLRRMQSVGPNNVIGPDGKLRDGERWVTVAEDDFERTELGDDWVQGGQWSIVDGQAVGVLAPTPYGPGVNAANLASSTAISSDFAVSFNVRIDQPMCVEAKVSDAGAANAISSLYVGKIASPFNRGEKGVAVIQAFRGNYRDVGSRRDGPFSFELDQTYRFTTRRVGRRVDLFIGNDLYRTVDLAIETPMPMLSLQGIFGDVGAKIYLDNVVIKVPPEGVAEVAAAEVVAGLFEEHGIKPLVLDTLKAMDATEFSEPSIQTRLAAIKLATQWYQERDVILSEIETLATEGTADTETYRALFEWLDQSVREKTQRVSRATSLCAYRIKNYEPAWKTSIQAKQMHLKEHGSKHPIDVVVPALMMWNNGKLNEARTRMSEVNQLMLSDQWQIDDMAVAWAKLARETIDAEVTDPVFTALSAITWESSHSMLIEGNVQPLANSLTNDATRTLRRISGDDAYALTNTREDWIESERAWTLSGPSTLRKLVRVGFSVSQDSPTPTATSHFIMESPDAHYGWIQNDVFKPQEGVAPEDWKIVKQQWRVSDQKIDDVWKAVTPEYWKQVDREVDEAAARGDAKEHLFSLMHASRLVEALQVAKDHASSAPSDPLAHVHLAEIAQWCGETQTVLQAARQAARLNPMVEAPGPIRAIITRALEAESPVGVTKNFTVRPPSFYRNAPTDLLGGGTAGLAAWQPTADSLIGIIRLPPSPELTLDEYVDAIIASRKSGFRSEMLRRTTRRIDGYEAIDYVQDGLGIGRAVAGSGRPMLQRFLTIDRDGERFLVFVSAYETDFEMRDGEFEQFLLTMKLSGNESMSSTRP